MDPSFIVYNIKKGYARESGVRKKYLPPKKCTKPPFIHFPGDETFYMLYDKTKPIGQCLCWPCKSVRKNVTTPAPRKSMTYISKKHNTFSPHYKKVFLARLWKRAGKPRRYSQLHKPNPFSFAAASAVLYMSCRMYACPLYVYSLAAPNSISILLMSGCILVLT